MTAGANSEPPSATTRIAVTSRSSGASLSRKPLAPARSAPNTTSSRSNVVSTSTREAGQDWAIRSVAWMPSSCGIRTSISTTWAGAPRPGHRLVPIPGLGYDLDAWFRPQDHPEARPDQRLVVGEDDADHATTSYGRTARTRNPAPSTGPTSSSPPATATRSRIPISPWPAPCGTPGEPVPSSQNSYLKILVAAGHGDTYPRARSMPQHIGQRLLNDAIRGQTYAGRKGAGVATDVQLHLQAGGFDEGRQSRQGRQRFPLSVHIGLT